MCRYLLQVVEGVSIHTPTQGVTFRTSSFNHFATVSIHTPTQGVTHDLCCALIRLAGFNPHTHAGCDLIVPFFQERIPAFQSTHPRRVWPHRSFLSRKDTCVSIHTPTQGVTPSSWKVFSFEQCFNPHTHAGCDSILIAFGEDNAVSIHTPTQGVTSL